MQGWRKSMEDASITELDIGDGNSLFGVFDGHGGREVAAYVSLNFKSVLLNCDEYKQKDYMLALE
jgi:protein phosphatase 1G